MGAIVKSTCLIGVDAYEVSIETQINRSLNKFSIIGLPDSILKEAKDRVRCAVENSGFEFPGREIIVSLSPASLPKSGSDFDLGIALSILCASGQMHQKVLEKTFVLGELALDGTLKAARGALATAIYLREHKENRLIISEENAQQVSLVEDVEVYAVQNLKQLVAFLLNICPIEPLKKRSVTLQQKSQITFSDVVGQHHAKRALTIAAAGGHNVVMIGPPGAGKSMLAHRISSILPPLSIEEAIEVTKVYSASNIITKIAANVLIEKRPIRTPHHSTSTVGLVGGGTQPLPGEISLAHKGVLFLDELPEFRRDALEALREPLEHKRVCISRSKLRVTFPSDFILIAAMNPCPCGYKGSERECKCSAQTISRYQSKISGPILDRIDMQIWVPAVKIFDLHKALPEDPTPNMRLRAQHAREKQVKRFKSNLMLNAHMGGRQVRAHCVLDSETQKLLVKASEQYNLTARSYTRILKLSRTIADLEEEKGIKKEHVMEALSYRLKMAA